MVVRNKRLRKRLFRVLPIVATLAVLLASLLLVSDFEQSGEGFSAQYIWVLSLTVAALVILILTIVARFISLMRKIRNESPGARLSARWVRNFLLLSIPPALIVYFFSAYFLTRTIDGWFDVQVETALSDSLALGQEFLDNRTLEVRNRMRRIGQEVEGLETDSDRLRRALLRRVSAAGPSELTVLRPEGQVVATASFNALGNVTEYPGDYALVQATERGEYAAAESIAGGGLRIRVIQQIEAAAPGDPDLLLQAIFPLPDNITALTESIEQEYHRYQNISYLGDSLKRSFLLILTLVLGLTVLLAILAALNTARRMVAPISELAHGTKQVAEGDLQYAVETRGRDELAFLAQSFNQMTEALLKASQEAESGRARLQAQGEYLETVLGSLSAGVLSLDPGGRIVRANRAAEQILALPSSTSAGHKLVELADAAPQLGAFTEAVMHKISRGRKDWQEEIRLDGPGTSLVLLVRGSQISGLDGEPGGHVIVFDDVTVLNRAQRDAAWAEVARRLAHEVKNPLTPIRLAAERLRMKLMDKLEARDGQMLDKAAGTIVTQVEALRKLVDAFGDYASEPVMDRSELDLARLVREVASLYQEGDPALNIELELVEGPRGLSADGGQIRQLLHNLIRNANEAVPPDSSASITIRSQMVNDEGLDWLELEINDEGPGFPQSVLDNPFEPYVTHKPDGSGLGLAICRKIVENHDGRIRLGNTRQGGATVRLRLPLDGRKQESVPRRDTA
ncbi:MAG: HAMP domain-containing protein [Xanthomonadales bacterium]|nr:HAMP domain-containing protein [Xanthomonadales bacterium]